MSNNESKIHWFENNPDKPEGEITASNVQGSVEHQNTPNLDEVGRDLTKLAKEGKLNPLFGRKKELRNLQRILIRKQKSNPVLIGEPGVGKTTLIEGFASLIVNQESHQDLRDIRVVEIIPSMIIASTEFRGSFEEKLQGIISEAISDKKLILFIDEIHTIIRTGSLGGSALDFANIIKPALARGEIRCIGSTTLDEYDKYIKSDPAFERRFEPLILEEPTVSEAIEIIQAAIPTFEKFHNVKILEETVATAVRLSNENILDRRLPDKAFDLLDMACTFVRLPETDNPDASTHNQIVTPDDITKALAEKLEIPVEKLNENIKDKLVNLKKSLNKRIIGQTFAIDCICSSINSAYTGLHDPKQPRFIFAFFGSSGIGKTETAKALAEYLFDSPNALIRLDLSEYQERIALSRLLGASPGYIGYDDEGSFATRLRRQPFSIVLLDEIEKAHPQILDVFLQIFDEGRFTDARGRMVEARHAGFVLTSNLFKSGIINSQEDFDNNSQKIRQSLTSYLRPEFINRIKEIIPFRELSIEDLEKIAENEIEKVNKRLSTMDLTIEINPDVTNWIAETAELQNNGARGVIRIVQDKIAEPISNKIINEVIKGSSALEVYVKNDSIEIRIIS